MIFFKHDLPHLSFRVSDSNLFLEIMIVKLNFSLPKSSLSNQRQPGEPSSANPGAEHSRHNAQMGTPAEILVLQGQQENLPHVPLRRGENEG